MITPEMIISYPKVFVPEQDQYDNVKYSCQVRINKTDKKGVAALVKAVALATEEGRVKKWKGKVPHFKNNPLRDGDAELAEGIKDADTQGEYAGKIFFSATRNGDDPAPGIVDAYGAPLMDQTKLYAGCIVRLDVKPFPYAVTGNNGVAWYLRNIMVVRDGDRLDGTQSAEDAFAKYAKAPGEDDLA